jgi:hypothetical protein
MQSPYNLHALLRAAKHAGDMRKQFRTLLIGVSAMLALGTLTACSSGSSTEATPSQAPSSAAPATAAPFPTSARYMADIEKDGKKMAIGISVDGNDITAYACNGVDDEAWFFGNQADGKIDVKSRFRDTLSAHFTGNDVQGDLTMNGVAYKFTAAPASGVAGMYTAELNGVRASWVVREDGSAIGVQFNGGISGRDFEQAELQQLKDDQFRAQVRSKRQLQQASQISFLQNKSASSSINGHQVAPTLVTGTFRLS